MKARANILIKFLFLIALNITHIGPIQRPLLNIHISGQAL